MSDQPQDDRPQGMRVPTPDYGRLGIGVEVWVDLHQAEKDAIARKLSDRSHVLLRWPSVRVLLALLRHMLANGYPLQAQSLERLTAEIARLREYVQHKPGCDVNRCECGLLMQEPWPYSKKHNGGWQSHPPVAKPCSCGLTAPSSERTP